MIDINVFKYAVRWVVFCASKRNVELCLLFTYELKMQEGRECWLAGGHGGI